MTRKTIYVCDTCGTDFSTPPEEVKNIPSNILNTIQELAAVFDGKSISLGNLDFCSSECMRLYVANVFDIKRAPLQVEVSSRVIPVGEVF